MDERSKIRAREDDTPQLPKGERISLHPLSLEDAIDGLLRTEPPADPAATLDALTFADSKVADAMDGGGRFISHDELMERLGKT